LTPCASTGPRRKIRVLTVCPQLTTGGAERQLLYFCRYADRSRFDVRVIYYQAAGDFLEALRGLGIPVVHIDRSRLGALGLLKALRREITSQQPDILDCRLPSGYRFGRVAALRTGVPVVVAQERACMRASGARRLLDRLLNPWTAAWVGNSRAVADHVIRDLGVSPDRVYVIYNGIETGHFCSAVRHPALDRLKQEGHRVVLNLGGLKPVKNQKLFLRVCRRLGRQFADLAFVFCGDGVMRASLEASAAELGLAERCHFVGHQTDVAPVLAAADLLIQTSDSEGLPNAVMEAMAAGVPVVATNVGGTWELVEDTVTGLLAPKGDEDALVARAAAILADPVLAGRLREAAAARIRDGFSLQAMVDQYESLFARLLEEAGAPTSGL